MANLITEKQKKVVRSDYFMRLFSVSLFIPISLLGIFLLAYVIPYYIFVNNNDVVTSEQFVDLLGVENKENVGESASSIVKRTVEQMRAVELYSKDNLVPSVYFDKIIENKNSSIQINKLSFTPVNKKEGKISLGGVSRNREGLVTFFEDLKSKAGFNGIGSPVSGFAQDSNIPFTINILINI